MPFTAVVDKELVNIVDTQSPKVHFAGKDISCPACGNAMHIRGSIAVSDHFAHNPTQNDRCPYAAYSSGESARHKQNKIMLYQMLSNRMKNGEARMEHILSNDDIKIIADVSLTGEFGLHVHEVQLSYQSIDEFQRRTEERINCGATGVVWWVCENLISKQPQLREWLRYQGVYGVVVEGEERLELNKVHDSAALIRVHDGLKKILGYKYEA